VKRVVALIAHEGKPTADGREIAEVTVPEGFVDSRRIPVVDGRTGSAREVIGSAYVQLENALTKARGVIAHCEIYDDAAAALLAPGTPLRLVAEMVGQVEVQDEEEHLVRVFTEPETRPAPPRFRLTGEVRGVTLTQAPAWDDLWVKEASDVG
jgi:hypothetical protein